MLTLKIIQHHLLSIFILKIHVTHIISILFMIKCYQNDTLKYLQHNMLDNFIDDKLSKVILTKYLNNKKVKAK